MGSSSARALVQWLKIPLTRNGRAAFAWYLSSGVEDADASSGALPIVTWSQDGEDLFFDETFPTAGCYVDVGAHHPDRFSVTKKLYDRGWQGVNIDFSLNFEENFARRRPRDVNVKALVGTPRRATFWRFDEAALSTLDEARADALRGQGWRLADATVVEVRTLSDILCSVGFEESIDLLSVDVEGADLDVLQSLDWERWRVQRCLVEISEPACTVADHPIAEFLTERGLSLTRVWGRSCLFERLPFEASGSL